MPNRSWRVRYNFPVPAKLTGERPVAGATPDSLLALHHAGYVQVASRLGPGKVLDVGCGTGLDTLRLGGVHRQLFGADYDPPTAAAANRLPGLHAVCSDGARLAFRAGAFDWVCSSHLIEHFVTPDEHAAELSRVLAASGTAFVITPNRPADFENPYHVSLMDDAELGGLLRRHFDEVSVLGLDGSHQVKEDFARRRRTGERLLALDVLDLRHKVPRSWYIAGYSLGLRIVYRLLRNRYSGGTTGIDAAAFFVTDHVDDITLVLLAVCRSPKRHQPSAGQT